MIDHLHEPKERLHWVKTKKKCSRCAKEPVLLGTGSSRKKMKEREDWWLGRDERQLPNSTLNALRSILVYTLARENLGPDELCLKDKLDRLKSLKKMHYAGMMSWTRSLTKICKSFMIIRNNSKIIFVFLSLIKTCMFKNILTIAILNIL